MPDRTHLRMRRRTIADDDRLILCGAVGIFGSVGALILVSIAAWITHVVVCIKTASWILLLFGCIVAPIGVIHGIGVWLGAF